MTIKANIQAASEARRRVRSHHMAARVQETKEHLLVIYPLGFYPDAVRVSMANGITWAADKAIEKMDEAWKNGAPQ